MIRFLVRTFLLLAVVAVVVGGMVWSFWPQPVPVEWTEVRRGHLQVTVDEDGKTRIKERYVVAAPLGGRLQRIELDPGAPVTRETTVLAQIQPHAPELLDARTVAQAEAKVKAAEATLARLEPLLERAQVERKFAETDLIRLRNLAKTNAVSVTSVEQGEMLSRSREQDYRAVRFAQDVARFELEMAKAALLQAQPSEQPAAAQRLFPICAPVTGQVLRVFQESSKVVQPGERLLEVGDPTDLEVEVDVLSSDAVKIQRGAKAALVQWGGERPLAATVRRIEPSAFTKISALGVEEQRVNVILDLAEPPEQRRMLGDGFRVEARIVIWEQDNVLQVPTGALFRRSNQWAVFVVEGSRAVLRTVEIGQRNSLAAEVLSGLTEGDAVILHPSDKVREDATVRTRDVGAAEVPH